MIVTTQKLGYLAEQHACNYLIARGLKLLNTNFRSRFGEIDLIMQDHDTLVFIEVRFRQNTLFGTGANTVTLTKQKKIIKTAWNYLQKKRLSDTLPCRFDVVAVTFKDKHFSTEWIQNAFQLN